MSPPTDDGDDGEAIALDTWAEFMVARGVERRLALKCAGDIWESLEKSSRQVEAFHECLMLKGLSTDSSPFAETAPDFDEQAFAYAERKGRGAERLQDECVTAAGANTGHSPRLSTSAEQLLAKLEEIANSKSTHASLLNLAQAFFACLLVRQWPSVAGFSATDLEKFTQCSPAQFLKKVRAWSDFTGLPVPRARSQRIKSKISEAMLEKNAHRGELHVYRKAA